MELQPATPAPVASVRDWAELPLDALSSVFADLGAVGVLMGAGLVCHSWLEASKAPELWRRVEMGSGEGTNMDAMCAMANVAVDRSDGKLEVFVGENFITDEVLKYIGARSRYLKALALVSCHQVTNEGFADVISKSPLLKVLMLRDCPGVTGDAYVVAGKACPQLKRFTLRKSWLSNSSDANMQAAGMAMMRELRYLALIGSEITNDELMLVVDGCPRLERLRMIRCYNIDTDSTLRAKCAGIRTLELPPPKDEYIELLSSRDVDGWESE